MNFFNNTYLSSNNLKIYPRYYFYLKILICLNPLIFSSIVILTDFVDYRGVTESAKYISIAQKWLGYSTGEVLQEVNRLPLYPIFISIIFKIFGNDNLIALLIIQSFLGAFTFIYLIKTLKLLGLGNSIIILLTLFFNLHIIYRFSVFYPNCLFIFLLTLFMYNFTNFFFFKSKKHFYFMCLTVFLMLLTRPIFQLSIFLTFPIIIVIVLKQSFTKFLKFKLIFILVLSYLLGMGIQYSRNYNEHGSFTYTTQSGQHLTLWVIPCLVQKYGCGSRNMQVHQYLRDKYNQKISKGEYNEVEKNEIKTNIGLNYLINEIDKKQAVISIFFSYTKLLFHTSLTEIYPKFQIDFKNFSLLDGDSFFEKLKVLFKKTFSDPKYFLWTFSLFFLFLMRFAQIIGIFSIFKNKNIGLYVSVITSLTLVLLIPAVAMGNPRYRSELEPLLLILGAIGINYLLNSYRKYFK